MSVDGGRTHLLHAVALTHGSRPLHALISVEIKRLHTRPCDLRLLVTLRQPASRCSVLTSQCGCPTCARHGVADLIDHTTRKIRLTHKMLGFHSQVSLVPRAHSCLIKWLRGSLHLLRDQLELLALWRHNATRSSILRLSAGTTHTNRRCSGQRVLRRFLQSDTSLRLKALRGSLDRTELLNIHTKRVRHLFFFR